MSDTATGQQSDSLPLLRVRHLKQYFPVRRGLFARVANWVKAVDDISFDIYPGETLALVGESGCGKTSAGRALLRLSEPTAGDIEFDGSDLLALNAKALRALRCQMQIIFQDPYSSLNPRMTIGRIIGEAIKVHGLVEPAALRPRVEALLERVGLSARYLGRYPHEFSGGQRQRIGIARALALNPKFIVCDEAVSALDVSVQAQIINLLRDLQQDYGLAYLFISHDLNVVQYIADRVAVMYLGKIVEIGPAAELFANPRHPYTQALIAANPIPDPTKPQADFVLQGDVPSPLDPPAGCPFHTRCPQAMEHCRQEEPQTRTTGSGQTQHAVCCHLYD